MNPGVAVGRRQSLLALVSGICFFLAAQASQLGVLQANGLTAVWIGNGVLLGILLSQARGRMDVVAICFGGYLGSILTTIVHSGASGIGLIFGVANIIEVLLAFGILAWSGMRPGPLARVQDVILLLVACLVAPIFSGLIGAGALAALHHVPFAAGFVGWYLAAALGLALATPAVVTIIELAEASRRLPLRGRRVGEIVLILSLVAGATLFVFYGAHHSSLFLLTPMILLATFRLRQFGAVASVGIIAAIAALATTQHFGPIAEWGSISHSGQLIYLQIFLAVTLVSTLPVSAALAERDLRSEEAHLLADHFKAVVENIDDVIFRTDDSGRWTYLNPAWKTLSGYGVAESLGRSWRAVIDPDSHLEVADWARPVFSGEVASTRRLVRFRTASGAVRWMELAIHHMRSQSGDGLGVTGMLRDVHDRKQLEEQVMSAKRLAEERERAATLLASTDELTGLPNRRAFLAHLDRQIAADGGRRPSFALAIFDVDHFKAVNDRHGHAVGDLVLQRVAARAMGIVRSGDVVGRIGGEEFGILMPGASVDVAMAVADRFRAAMAGANTVDGVDEGLPAVTVSIGIAAYLPGQNHAQLLAEADAALYAAKDDGRNRTKIAA